jgi:hypothetical protein
MGETGRIAAGALALLVIALSPLPAAAAADDAPLVLDDFEAPALKAGWSGLRASVKRADVAGGGALEVSGWSAGADEDSAAILSLAGLDLRKYGKIAWQCSSTEGPLSGQVLFRYGKGCRILWSKWTAARGEGASVELPLAWFDDADRGLCAPLTGATSVELRWRKGAGRVLIDDLRLLPPAKGEPGPRPRIQDYLALAFEKGDGKSVESRNLALLTDIPELQGAKGQRMLAKLEEGITALSERFALKGAMESKGVVVVFRGMADADAFGARLAQRMGQEWSPIPDGTAALGRFGLALTWLADGNSPYLPALAHEAMHPVVQRLLLLESNTWVQEGVVTSIHRRLYEDYYAAMKGKFRPISADSFRLALKGESSNLKPLSKFLTQGGFGFDEFIQLGSVFDYLAAKHRSSLPKVWEALRALEDPPAARGLPAVAGAVGLTADEFEADYVKWGATGYR